MRRIEVDGSGAEGGLKGHVGYVLSKIVWSCELISKGLSFCMASSNKLLIKVENHGILTNFIMDVAILARRRSKLIFRPLGNEMGD